jgi:hypothetical protein
LDGVDRLHDRLRRLVPEQAQPGNVPDALPQLRFELAEDRPVGAEQRRWHDRGKLHRLLFDGHLAQQLVRALHRCGI